MLDNLKAALVIAILGLLALLPLKWAHALGGWLGRRQARDRSGKLAANTWRNLEMCFPELDDAARDRLATESLEHTGRTSAEMGMSWFWSPRRSLKKVRSVHGEEVVRQALAEGRGVILMAPHLGNWELLNLYVSNRYRPFTAMYKPPQLKLIDDLIRRRRARLGTDMAPANASGVRMVMKALKRGEMVGILPDQQPDRSGGIFAPFFGIEALTMKLVPQLARQTGARVICGYARRLPKGEGYDIHFRTAEDGVGDRDLQQAAAAMNRSVEACVRALPEQYQWEYRRFSERPEGQPKRYGKK
ncbi:lipid A biosynthesis lauroyl acyltransferase [Marinobacterium nitratireducens]|uniref:Lipid A biosynthesis lauroyl acyltransferase n=1 Tax=Marinobacterium nitratireducens TaxID=518897 RepID=A0A917Z7Q9_9GAMM|nr:lysophospholipid acyltransferase family protein [Marinobacterium nitratireducens]GGO77423.1 lipid A biosynthesis lauroyl acyltransferase [Marinobacterium nitratireducens]